MKRTPGRPVCKIARVAVVLLRRPRGLMTSSGATEGSAMTAVVEPWLSHRRWGELEGSRRLNGRSEVVSARLFAAGGRCTADVLGRLACDVRGATGDRLRRDP